MTSVSSKAPSPLYAGLNTIIARLSVDNVLAEVCSGDIVVRAVFNRWRLKHCGITRASRHAQSRIRKRFKSLVEEAALRAVADSWLFEYCCR